MAKKSKAAKAESEDKKCIPDNVSYIYTRRLDMSEDFPDPCPCDENGNPPDWKWYVTEGELRKRITEKYQPIEAFLYEMSLAPRSRDVENDDAITTFRDFIACHELGIYPPQWIMDNLYKVLNSYMEKAFEGDYRTLDASFKIGKKDFGEIHREALYRELSERADALYKNGGMTREQAVTTVIANLELDNKTKYRIAPGVGSLEKQYYKWLKAGGEQTTKVEICKSQIAYLEALKASLEQNEES